eukprot:CAMPEP_0202100878 /NCGR_PEP_ID=MMETSP0965-20130614/3403_1 /ASSEMBLY_ACC=CAM_ASM_000507 /TAXON_ID=4773 /ORGANISM="Schizochytrium aggregatum, Strain ATCC28209" /LENGTH=167 /DNA_ID=CAMNT_0048669557 /DNA_START=324 /DNA_END=825 /DNA_ORIENTATION=+
MVLNRDEGKVGVQKHAVARLPSLLVIELYSIPSRKALKVIREIAAQCRGECIGPANERARLGRAKPDGRRGPVKNAFAGKSLSYKAKVFLSREGERRHNDAIDQARDLVRVGQRFREVRAAEVARDGDTSARREGRGHRGRRRAWSFRQEPPPPPLSVAVNSVLGTA